MSNGGSRWLIGLLVAGLAVAGCSSKRALLNSQIGTGVSSEPDKVLYGRAVNDIQHGRYELGRLSLQTLINTYPDSEYLAKAKLAMGDSYYKQGGVQGSIQAVAEYQDFITFFPFLDEASYAQMQIGMTHYRQMEKPDRDRSETLAAEQAFQTYLGKYPDGPMAVQAEQRLREVQEVLADGQFRIANFYYIRHADRATTARLTELANRYPLYSQADRVNWMLGELSEKNEHNDLAATYFGRLVKNYPLSPFAANAKTRLVKLGVRVPDPDPVALARMQKEQQMPRSRPGMLTSPITGMKTRPNVSMAARVGTPTLTPETESDIEGTLIPEGNLSVGGGSSLGGSTGSGAYVETVSPGSSSSTSTPASSADQTAGDPAPNAASGTAPASSDAASTTASPAPSNGNSKESPSKKKRKFLLW